MGSVPQRPVRCCIQGLRLTPVSKEQCILRYVYHGRRRRYFGSRLLSFTPQEGPLRIPSAAQSIRRKALIALNSGMLGYDDEVGYSGSTLAHIFC